MAASLLLIGILIRPADYIPHALRAGGPGGFSAVDLAPALLLFLLGVAATLGCREGRPILRTRRVVAFIVLAIAFKDYSINHLLPVGVFFLAAAAGSIAAGIGATRPVRFRMAALVALLGIHPVMTAFASTLYRDAASVLLGAASLSLAGSIAGTFRLNKTLNRFLADTGALAVILLGFAAFYYFGIPPVAGAVMLNPVTLSPGFSVAAIGISLGLMLISTLIIDRIKIPFFFSIFILAGENGLLFWLIPFALHAFFFSRFTIATPSGPVIIRDRMFYNMMDMWNQVAANVMYVGLLVFFGILVSSALSERKIRFRL